MAEHYVNFDAATNGNGTFATPWNNFASAQAGIVRGDTVNLRGLYRGEMVFTPTKGGLTPSAKTKWLGSLEDPFIVDAGEVLSGFQQCGAADVVDVGSNATSMFKVTVPKSYFPGSNPYNANICEAGVQIPIAVSRAQTFDKFFIDKPQYFWTADLVGLSGANIISFRLAAATDPYTELQIERAQVYYVASPNVAARSAVSSFNPATKVITLATPGLYENSTVKDNFALANLLPAMKRGEWGFKDNGTTVTLYVWPQNTLSVAGQISYAARGVGININGTSNIEIAYFKTRHTATAERVGGNLFNTSQCSHVHLHNFESSDSLNTANMEAGVYMNDVDDLTMHHFDVRRISNAWGIFCQGSGASNADAGNPGLVNLMERTYVHHFTVAYCSAAPLRMFTCGNGIFAYGIYWACGRRSHGNTMNAYQSSYNLLWWGIDGEDADGFFTIQEADSIVMAFCSASPSRAPSGGAKGIFQQQNAVAKQGSVYGYKQSACFNCRSTVNRIEVNTAANGLRWGSSFAPLDRVRVFNNIYHGHSAMTAGDKATIDQWDYNIITGGVETIGANDVISPPSVEYVDGNTNKFVYKPGALARSKQAYNATAFIAELTARFAAHVPAFTDWDKDMVGDTFTWTAGADHIGCGPTKNKDALMGEARGITYAGVAAGSDGGGGGEPTRPVFAPGFKIKVAA